MSNSQPQRFGLFWIVIREGEPHLAAECIPQSAVSSYSWVLCSEQQGLLTDPGRLIQYAEICPECLRRVDDGLASAKLSVTGPRATKPVETGDYL